MANPADAALRERPIRSFVKRSGRKTEGQRHALTHYWPQYGIEYDASQALDLSKLFPAAKGVKLEIGFGNGESLVQMAQHDPDFGYIGIEVHTPGVGHCLARLHEAGLDNLRLISHDAIEVLTNMLPANALDALFLFFPDPWHKKRHHKRRIVNAVFRDQAARVLTAGGRLHMATDWRDYARYMAREMLADERFCNLGDEQGFCPKPAYRPTTKFERRGQRLGHDVWDLCFQRRAD